MARKFTSIEIARILCAVDPLVMRDALQIREMTCLTTLEWALMLLDLLLSVLPVLPTTGALRTTERVLEWITIMLISGQNLGFPHFPPLHVDEQIYGQLVLPPVWPGA